VTWGRWAVKQRAVRSALFWPVCFVQAQTNAGVWCCLYCKYYSLRWSTSAATNLPWTAGFQAFLLTYAARTATLFRWLRFVLLTVKQFFHDSHDSSRIQLRFCLTRIFRSWSVTLHWNRFYLFFSNNVRSVLTCNFLLFFNFVSEIPCNLRLQLSQISLSGLRDLCEK